MLLADVQLGWPAAALAMTPLIISALANTFAAIRADRNAKLAAAAAVAAKEEVKKVADTLEATTASTDKKLDATHGAVEAVKEQNDGHLTALRAQVDALQVALRMAESHTSDAEARTAEVKADAAASKDPIDVRIVAPIPDGVQSAGALLKGAPLPGNDPSSPEKHPG